LIPVPLSWQAFVGSSKVEFDFELIRDALAPQLSHTTATDPVRLLYRHAFVHLFNHLEKIGYLVRDGSISVKDLPNLVWLSQQLLSWNIAPTESRDKIFKEAIELWYPDGVVLGLLNALATESRHRKA
jgi:hypothetical protein